MARPDKTITDTDLDTAAPEGIIAYLPEEIDTFERESKRFRSGELEPDRFQALRLKQGVYGQRQPDVHMIRVKIPGGILTDKQLVALGKVAERYAPLCINAVSDDGVGIEGKVLPGLLALSQGA